MALVWNSDRSVTIGFCLGLGQWAFNNRTSAQEAQHFLGRVKASISKLLTKQVTNVGGNRQPIKGGADVYFATNDHFKRKVNKKNTNEGI